MVPDEALLMQMLVWIMAAVALFALVSIVL
jgi:hypothetical protein